MKLIDEIVELARTTEISKDDMQIRVNGPETIKKMEAKPEYYHAFVDSLVSTYQSAMIQGNSQKQAAQLVLGTFEDVLRLSLMRSLRSKLSLIDTKTLEAFDNAWTYANTKERLDGLKKSLEELEQLKTELLDKTPATQFKHSLLYACDRWGNTSEKKAVRSLVNKIKE